MKQTNFLKSFFLLCALIVGSSSVWADDVIYSETFGTTGNKTDVSSYSGFSSTLITPTSSGWKISDTSTSTCNITGTSGSCNAYCGGNSDLIFNFGNKLSNYTNVKLSFNYNKGSANGKANSLKLYISSDGGSSYGSDILPSNTGASNTWYAVTNITIPAAALSNLCIKFSSPSNTNRLDDIKITGVEAVPAYNITAQSNNNEWGTVSLLGSIITGSPKSGCRYASPAYTVSPANSATVSQNGNAFTVTPSANTTVTINFEVIPTYTVTFDAEGGTCGTTSATETIGGAGVTLPTATTGVAGWEFIGWAADAVDNTTIQPTLYKAGSTYYPTIDTELHAVYTLSETGYAYTRVTSLNQINASKKIAVTSQYGSKILNHDASIVNAPTETNNEITVTSDQMFALSGDNTTGYVLTGASGTLSQETLSTSGENDKSIDWSGANNKWIIELNTYADNLFALRNAASDKAALEQYSGWKTEYHNDYSSRQYTAMKLYIPKTAYNSNPSAIITPTVAFESADPVTIYKVGTTTNTNTATVTGVSKTINYTSSNTGVATVNSEGVVTAVGIGTTTITASVDAELGVSAPAYDTYEVTVKSATTLAGIKAQATSSTAVDFSADLASDLVITYVSGAHAYLQSGDVAVYACCATGDWEAGKKFAGAITGQIKRLNNEYQITSIGQTPVAGGIVPDAVEVAITDLTTANYATYEGRKIAINGATVNTAMTTSQNSGGKITTDGTNTLNIYAPLKGITLTKDEKGNFVGYIGRYNDGIRYYMYEQSQFTKTHNVPQNQDMAFATGSYTFDEGTDAVTSFAGQEVTKTTVKGAVTYAITGDAIGTVNAETGVVTLNGDCGTATIVATAAAYDEYDEGTGYYTPYKELTKEYSVTVRPRYTVTFSINGNTDEVRRQESYGAAITVPDVAAIGDYVFLGWSDTEVATTDVAPTMTTGNSITPTSTKTIYAVFANQTQTGTTDVVDQEYSYSAGTLTVDGEYTDNNTYYLLHEGGYVESGEFDLSIITKIEVTGGTYGGSSNNSLTISGGTNKWKDVIVSTSGGLGTDTYTGGAALSGTGKLRITSTCGGTTNGVRVSGFKIYKSAPVYGYSNYTTSLSTSVTIGESHYLSYCFMNKLDFSESDVKAYKASVDGEGKVTLTKVDVVPAGEGVVLYCETPDTYSIPVTTKDASDVTGNEMVGVLVRTQVVWNPTTGIYNYILQQGQFNKATDGYLKPNRAYLSTSYDVTPLGAKALSVVFAEDETDGIRSIENSRIENSDYYNLAGQKVGADYKGIVIVNGKKYMRK